MRLPVPPVVVPRLDLQARLDLPPTPPQPVPVPACPPCAVRAFSDVEKSRVRNHVLFASNADLAAVNLTAVLEAVEADAAARGTGGHSSDSGAEGSSSAGGDEVLDPLQLRVWRGLAGQEVQLTYDRQRCQQMLAWYAGGPPSGGRDRRGPGGQQGKQQPGQQQQQQQGRQRAQPWLWRAAQGVRERQVLATAHWVAMRTAFADSLWLS